jgi:hypothetical protein
LGHCKPLTNGLGLSATRSGGDPGRQGVGSNFESESNVKSINSKSRKEFLSNPFKGFMRSSHPRLPSVLGHHDQNTPQLNQQSSSKPELMQHTQTSSSQRPQNNEFSFGSQDISDDPGVPEVQDPLNGMNDRDRWGLKGYLSMLKGPYPDQAALLAGIDITALGIDLNSINE